MTSRSARLVAGVDTLLMATESPAGSYEGDRDREHLRSLRKIAHAAITAS
jgi:hypothetical protein